VSEGPDDMPAHVKSALIGASVTIPIKDGRLVSCLKINSDELCSVANHSSSPEPGKGSGILSFGRWNTRAE